MHAPFHKTGLIEDMLGEVLRQAEQHPHRRSEILGQAALGLAARAQRPQHRAVAPQLRQLAEQLAAAALEPLPALDTPATLDDFYELLQERSEGHQEQADDIDVIARAEEIHNERVAAHGAARVSIAPLSWGKGATLGRTGTFKFNPTSDEMAQGLKQSGTLAFWQGEPHEAQAITVDLAPPVDFVPTPLLSLPSGPAPGPDTSSRGYGVVAYGSDGAITQVKFDAGFGARFTVVGSYVSIVAGMDSPLSGALSGTLSYTASIGAFAAPSAAPVFLTEYIDLLGNGGTTAPFQRPMHATQILPILTDATAGNAVLRFYGQGGTTLLYQFAYPIGQLLNPLPLPAEAQYLTLTNGTGGVANFRVPFQLSL